jgi:hypothetical protein
LETWEVELQKKRNGQEKCDLELKQLEQEEIEIKLELKKLDMPLTAGCIKKRNDYVIHRMAMDFTIGRHELEQELDGQSDTAAALGADSSSSILRNGVHTFCVCSNAYQKFKGRLVGRMPIGFDVIEDTSVPHLMRHGEEFTFGARESVADDRCAEIKCCQTRWVNWADNTTPDTQTKDWQNEMLENTFKVHFETLQSVWRFFPITCEIIVHANVV